MDADGLPDVLLLVDKDPPELELSLDDNEKLGLCELLDVVVLLKEELLVTVLLGGGGVGPALVVILEVTDLVYPELLLNVTEAVDDLVDEVLRVPDELIELVLLVDMLEVCVVDKDEVLLTDVEDDLVRVELPVLDDVSDPVIVEDVDVDEV